MPQLDRLVSLQIVVSGGVRVSLFLPVCPPARLACPPLPSASGWSAQVGPVDVVLGAWFSNHIATGV